MSPTRRDILTTAAIASGLIIANRATALTAAPSTAPSPVADDTPQSPGVAGQDYTPVIVPNGWTLPFTVVDGVKVFHLVAEDVDHEFAPGLSAKCWGYNGSVHGPVIEAVEGDRVRIFVTNRLEEGTTVHWHGVITPSGMDGVGGLNQKAIAPGETYMYEFALRQHGTFMYHSHHDEMTQMGLGLVGMFVIHPRSSQAPRPDRDFAIMLHEWRIDPGAMRPDPSEMTDFNVLTMNARVFPGTDALVAKIGDRVRIRFGNLGAMDHHPIHLHGYSFTVTATGGGDIPPSSQYPDDTILVPVGSTRTIEFVANNPGDWALHCHMTHHVMNQMGHHLANMIGVKTDGLDTQVRPLLPAYMTMGQTGMADMGEMNMPVPANSIPMIGGDGPYDNITMGGMFTIFKVREQLSSYADPGWYKPPAGTVAGVATNDELTHNNISADGTSAPRPPKSALAAPAIVPLKSDEQMPKHDMKMQMPMSTPATTAVQQYTCVMHAEVVSDHPGKCPKCGMTLVAKN